MNTMSSSQWVRTQSNEEADAAKIAEIAERWKEVGMNDRDYCIRQLLKLVKPIPEVRR